MKHCRDQPPHAWQPHAFSTYAQKDISPAFLFCFNLLSDISPYPDLPSLQLPSLLPDLSPLPSCLLRASCSGSYHSRKRDTASTNTNLRGPPFSLTITAINGNSLAPLGSRCIQETARGCHRGPCLPLGPNLLMDLFIINNISPYFTAYRGTIKVERPGMFLFMYLFIWEEAVGTLGYYQLLLLWGVFL